MKGSRDLYVLQIVSEHATETLFHMNHTRILGMKAGKRWTTNNGNRFLPTARAMDCMGIVGFKMWEKAVLALAGVSDKQSFVDLASKCALNFPALWSLSVNMYSLPLGTTCVVNAAVLCSRLRLELCSLEDTFLETNAIVAFEKELTDDLGTWELLFGWLHCQW